MTPNRPAARVRRARAADYIQIRELGPELTTGMAPWRSSAGQHAAVTSWVDASLASADDEGHAVFVAASETDPDEPSKAVLGFVCVVERTHFTGEREAYVGELVVARCDRKRGFGRALMAAAEDRARRRGLARISLQTGASNSAARAAYAKLGYLNEGVTLSKSLH